MVELKGKKSGKATCEIIESFPKGVQESIVFSGRDLKEIRDAHRSIPSIPICLNITKCKKFRLKDLYRSHTSSDFPFPFKMFSLKSELIQDSKFIDKCHELGSLAFSWNFYNYTQPQEKIKTLLELGMDGILFDSPQTVPLIREYLKD